MWHWLLLQPLWLQVLAGVIALLALFAIFSLVGVPVLALVNRLLARSENSTAESAQDYLLGELTLRVPAGGTGEVMITGNGRARQTYPAKGYGGEALPQGTAVVIIAVKQGVAYVQAAKQLDTTK